MSAFLRRRMRGLLRAPFSAPNSTDAVSSIGAHSDDRCEEAEEEEMLMMLDNRHKCRAGPSRASATVYQRILNGKNGRRQRTAPEVYSGKTGLELPTIHIDQCSREVKTCHTGPDGGLTKVQPMRQSAIAKMIKLDDEEFSLSSMDEEESALNSSNNVNKKRLNGKRRAKESLSNVQSDSIEALGFDPAEDGGGPTTSSLSHYDWNGWDEERAYGLSTSLYEKHPVTGLSAGHPIADVFGIIVRENNAILALADGVNWGEGARLAARCAIRGALDHLNAAIERGIFVTTNDIFHCLLGSFHAAHTLILQEGGALTTLCVALVAPVRDSNVSVLCTCNVGDSLCFVYNNNYGVREVTLASHDIAQMRDMRDAGGALGPVDGRNPQLQNLTCSMTFVEDGDLVFITSDGISDNFDPVVGKFCVIKRNRGDSGSEKENTQQQQSQEFEALTKQPQFFHKTKSAPTTNGLVNVSSTIPSSLRPMMKRPTAILPCVDALERHELMLLRMSDVIPNGLGSHRLSRTIPASSTDYNSKFNGNSEGSPNPSNSSGSPRSSTRDDQQQHLITAAELCRNLIQFSYQLSAAKRRTLEDPELYRTRTHSKTEERLRRKVIRDMIMEMPGKLDHASVVAYRVGKWPPITNTTPPLLRRMTECNGGGMELDGVFIGMDRYNDNDEREEGVMEEANQEKRREVHQTQSDFFVMSQLPQHQPQQEQINCNMMKPVMSATTSTCSTVRCEDNTEMQREHQQQKQQQDMMQRFIISHQQWKCTDNGLENTKKKNQRHHERGSQARHTLGVDVSWLKRLVTSKHETQQQQMNKNDVRTLPFGEHKVGRRNNGNIEDNFDSEPTLSLSSINNIPITTTTTEKPPGNFSLRKLRVFMRQQQQAAPITCQNTSRVETEVLYRLNCPPNQLPTVPN